MIILIVIYIALTLAIFLVNLCVFWLASFLLRFGRVTHILLLSGAAVFLALTTGYVVDIELESGLFSYGPVLFLLDIPWLLTLLITYVGYAIFFVSPRIRNE